MPGFWRKLSAQSKHSNAAQVGDFWKESDYTILQTLHAPGKALAGKVVEMVAEDRKNATTALNHQTDGSW